MRTRLIPSTIALLLSLTALSASAQTISGPALSDEQNTEFALWVRAEREWRQWVAEHRNVPDRNWMGMTGRDWIGRSKDRRERPVPPAWIDPYCDAMSADARDADETCRQYDELKNYDWATESLRQQFFVANADKPEHTHFNLKRHWGFGLGYDNRMIHGSLGMQMTIAEWGRWNYGTLGASLGFIRSSKLNQKTGRVTDSNDAALFVTMASASYRIKYLQSLGMYWYVDFAQIYDMTHNMVGSQFGFSLSRK